MKLPVAHFPTTSVSPIVLVMSWALAVVIIAIVVIQLMTYEKFVPLIQNYQLFNSPALGKVCAALIVIFEVMALPFLLRMKLSPLMRIFSAGCLVAVSVVWIILSLWAGSSVPGQEINVLLNLFDVILLLSSIFVIWCLRHDFKT